MRFGIDLGANLDPFWPDFSVLGVSWGALGASWGRLWEARCRLGAFSRGLNFLNDFGIDFLIILVSFWEPSSARLGPRSRPKSAKNLTGGLPGGVPWTDHVPKFVSGSFCNDFFKIFHGFYWFLDNFCLFFCGILDEFGRLFPGFLIDFSKCSTGVFSRCFYFLIHITRIYT